MKNKACIIAVSHEERNCIKCGPAHNFVFTHKSSCGYQVSYPQSFQKPPFDTYLVASPVPGRNRLRLLDCKTVLQCCARDVGRAGFRGAVVGAIFFLQRAVFFVVLTLEPVMARSRAKRSVVGFTLTSLYTSIVIVVNADNFCG